MLRNGGEQHQPAYRAVNPLGLVPTLETGDGRALTQSMAICGFLDESPPDPALLPHDIHDMAWLRSICHALASHINHLNTLPLLNSFNHQLKCGSQKRGTRSLH